MKVTSSLTRGDLEAKLNKLGMTEAARVAKANHAAAEYLFKQSQELVPVDTGALKESGRVGQEGSGYDTSSTVNYGEADFEGKVRVSTKQGRSVFRYPYKYAKFVHFGWTGKGGKAGRAGTDFLKIPLGNLDGMRAALRAALKEVPSGVSG